MDILKRIADERKLKGLTWSELAAGLPVTGEALRVAFKRGKVQPEYLSTITNNLNGQNEQREEIKNPPNSMEDILSEKIMEKLLPIINKVLESHQKIIKELLAQGVDIDELKDDLDDVKESVNEIKKDVKKIKS